MRRRFWGAIVLLLTAGSVQAAESPLPGDPPVSIAATAVTDTSDTFMVQERQERQQLGVYVLLYLLVFVGLAYMTVRVVWRDQPR